MVKFAPSIVKSEYLTIFRVIALPTLLGDKYKLKY